MLTADVKLLHTLKGLEGSDYVRSTAWSPDGKQIASGSVDGTVHLWDPEKGLLLTLKDQGDPVSSVAWSPDSKRLASSSYDGTVQLWDAAKGELLHTLTGHDGQVFSVAWSPDGKHLASGANDKTVRLWNATTGALRLILKGHEDGVRSVSWSPDNKHLASGANDKTVRLWNAMSGKPLHILEGHTHYIRLVAWSPNGRCLASGSHDRTVKLWDPTNGALLDTLDGHEGLVCSVAWFPNGPLLASVSYDGSPPSFNAQVHFWHTDTWVPLAVLNKELTGYTHSSWHPVSPLLATVGKQKGDITIWRLSLEEPIESAPHANLPSEEPVHYTNAKVVLVGDSSVGKSGLALVLSDRPFEPTESTHGRRVWSFDHQTKGAFANGSREIRETLLWDLAGQPGYRLIHQLHLNEVSVALVVFDAHSETDPFAGVHHWDRALRIALRTQGDSALPMQKFLVAARVDRCGAGVSRARIDALVRELGFAGYFETSAKEGTGIAELAGAIRAAINWEVLTKVTSNDLFQRIKDFLVAEKESGRLLPTVEDLYHTFLKVESAPVGEENLRSQFEACIGRVESRGLIRRLSFGDLILLQPERLDAYASALVNAVKDEPDGFGSIAEARVQTGDFSIPRDERIKNKEQEKLLLLAMVEDLLQSEIALRETAEDGLHLVFPSQSTRENPELPDPAEKTVVFSFEGPVQNIYATLTVRLSHSGLFRKMEIWKNAVTYQASMGGICGLFLRNTGEGRGELTLFYDQAASQQTRRQFEDYVHIHLQRRALSETIKRRRIFVCNECGFVVSDQLVRMLSERGFNWVDCPVCKTYISLRDREQPLAETSSRAVEQMDSAADSQRDRATAQTMLQGKIKTRDFDVFLCHNGADKPAVKVIGAKLKKLGILPWLDEWELRPGLPWQRLLEEQIDKIKSAAVFVGKNGRGPWQDKESYAFLGEFLERDCPVIPVILPDCEDVPKLPTLLRGMTWVDFRKSDPDPLQRLYWGITGERELMD